MTMHNRLRSGITWRQPLLLIGLLTASLQVNAAVMTYTDSVSFFSDLSSNGLTPQTENFDSVSAGTAIVDGGLVGGLTFQNFNLRDSSSLIIDDQFDTTSADNYLGENFSGNFNQITGGSEFDLAFGSSFAVGLFIITADTPGFTLFDNDIQLTVPSHDTANLDVDAVEQTLSDGSLVFFLGLIDDVQPFTSTLIRYDPLAVDAMFYNIDDITTATRSAAPTPTTLALIIIGIVGIGHTRHGRRSQGQ